jgi:isoquinoline 1-oxidoreductase
MTTRREFLAALGGGIVVLIAEEQLLAQETGGVVRGRNATPSEVSAWLHVGEDGTITGYTGKVEVGQNARTSLTQAIAEELHAPVASIRMVMGDTNLTPFDQGTVGSMTSPRMWPQVRRAAAEAREMLLDLGAKKWTVDRATLRIAEGRITAGSRSATFGELTRGEKTDSHDRGWRQRGAPGAVDRRR